MNKISRVTNEEWFVSQRYSQRARYNTVRNLILNLTAEKESMLDIGCANGHFCNLLSKDFINITGIDINSQRIYQNNKQINKLENINFMNMDLFKINHENEFDIITALEVIYYIDKTKLSDFFEKVKSLLKNNGYFILSTNIFNKEYMNEEQITEYYSRFFEIVRVKRIYRMLYYKIELPLLSILDSLKYIKKIKLFKYYLRDNNIFIYSKTLDRIFFSDFILMEAVFLIVERISLRILKSKLVYKFFTGISKLFAPRNTKSQVIIIGKRK